jgi:hypothetical protein
MYSSSFLPQVPGRFLPREASNDTLLKCFSCVTHRWKRAKHTLKIDLKTQLQGERAPFLARRNPDPWQ